MALPELRFMQDKYTRDYCLQEAKKRVQAQRRKGAIGYLVLGYMVFLALLLMIFNYSLLKMLLGMIVFEMVGPYLYWLVLRNRLRQSLREVIRELIGYCTTCGYSSKGNVSGTCPECGTQIDVEISQ